MTQTGPRHYFTFRFKGTAFETTANVNWSSWDRGLATPDNIARCIIRRACERLGGIAPSQLELIHGPT